MRKFLTILLLLIIIFELFACGAIVYFKLIPKFFSQKEDLSSQVTINKPIPSPKTTTESASPSAQTDETANWKTFRRQKQDENFEFKYPNDWEIRAITVQAQEVGQIETEVLISPSRNLNEASSSGVEMRFYENEKKKKEESLVQYATNNNACCSFQEISLGKIFVVMGEYKHENNLNLNYYISDGERIIFIDVYLLSMEKADFLNTINRIVSTFKFL